MNILAHKQHEACFQLVCNGQEKASIAVRHKEEEGAIARLPLESKITTGNESKSFTKRTWIGWSALCECVNIPLCLLSVRGWT